MKRRIVHLTGLTPLILGSVALLLFSCSQDESPLLAGGSGEAPLRITSVGLLSSEVSAIGGSVATRAATTDPLTTGSIGVFRSKDTNNAEEQANKKFSYTGGSWQPATTTDTVYLMTNPADVCAYYPYNEAYTDKTAIPLASGRYTGTVDDLTLHDPADLCYATNQPMSGGSSAAELTMEHAMAMVQLSFKRLKYESDRCNLTSITATNAKLVGSAKLNITTGALTALVKKSPMTWTPGSGTDTPTGIQVPETGIITTSFLCVPCSLNGAATTFSFTVDGQKMSTSVPATLLPDLQQGKIHRLNFVIHAASITIEGVSIVDWTEASALPPYTGKGRDYIVLPGMPDVKWALGNLVYTAPYGYSFAPTQSDYGSYLQWNVLTDTSETATTPEWNEANDPCSRVEPQGTWITPSKEDLEALAKLPRKRTTDNSKKGWWFGTTDETLAEAFSSEYLFLPAAGYRYSDGLIHNEGSSGHYWSRMPYESSYGYYLYFSFSFDDCYVTDKQPSGGQSVRCVKGSPRQKTTYDITSGTEVQIGSNTWATANLRTSNAGDSNFEFEKKPWITGVYPEEKLNGVVEATKTNLCFWNWGCLKTPFETPFLSGETIEWGNAGDDGTKGDPCAKITPFNTWKVPSKVQLEDLSKTDNRPAVGETVWMNDEVFTVTNASGWVVNNNNTIQGQVFVANGKAIFLPAPGYRYSTGQMDSGGSEGNYWSRTPAVSDCGYYLRFTSSSCIVNNSARDYGHPVRCVKEPSAP